MIRPYATAAFCNGYAEVADAPPVWSDAVRDAALASLTVAESAPDAVGILEAMRKNGRRTALYHALDAKRDELEARLALRLHEYTRRLGKVAAPLIADRLTHPQEAIGDVSRTQAQQIAQQALDSLIGQEAYRLWQSLTEEALMQGVADGQAAATLWLASMRGSVLPSFDIEFQAAMERLRNLTGPWADAGTWMGRQTHGLAYQMGNDLADAIAAGASRDELMAIVMGVMDGESNADLVLNYAISEVSSQGALDLYASESVQYIDVLVSPDACLECEALEVGNPYLLADDPGLPMHPNCRCSYSPVDPMNIYAPAA